MAARSGHVYFAESLLALFVQSLPHCYVGVVLLDCPCRRDAHQTKEFVAAGYATELFARHHQFQKHSNETRFRRGPCLPTALVLLTPTDEAASSD